MSCRRRGEAGNGKARQDHGGEQDDRDIVKGLSEGIVKGLSNVAFTDPGMSS
jgi:hypothetical protein